MEKFSSQSNKKNKSRQSEPGRVATFPLSQNAGRQPEPEPPAPGTDPDEALQKDLELLARMREQIDQLPDIDAARIVQLHERILRGEYRVDSDRLATKLGQFESDFPDSSN